MFTVVYVSKLDFFFQNYCIYSVNTTEYIRYQQCVFNLATSYHQYCVRMQLNSDINFLCFKIFYLLLDVECKERQTQH
jgi:hypothetical protein